MKYLKERVSGEQLGLFSFATSTGSFIEIIFKEDLFYGLSWNKIINEWRA